MYDHPEPIEYLAPEDFETWDIEVTEIEADNPDITHGVFYVPHGDDYDVFIGHGDARFCGDIVARLNVARETNQRFYFGDGITPDTPNPEPKPRPTLPPEGTLRKRNGVRRLHDTTSPYDDDVMKNAIWETVTLRDTQNWEHPNGRKFNITFLDPTDEPSKPVDKRTLAEKARDAWKVYGSHTTLSNWATIYRSGKNVWYHPLAGLEAYQFEDNSILTSNAGQPACVLTSLEEFHQFSSNVDDDIWKVEKPFQYGPVKRFDPRPKQCNHVYCGMERAEERSDKFYCSKHAREWNQDRFPIRERTKS